MATLEKIILRDGHARTWRDRVRDTANAVRSAWWGSWGYGDRALARFYDSPPAAAGVHVDDVSALGVPAFFEAVTTIAGDCAAMPLVFYKRLADGSKQRFESHYLYSLLHDAPNSEQTSLIFRESLLINALARGDGYAEIERDVSSRPRALWLIDPSRVTIVRAPNGALIYRVAHASTGGHVELPAADMIHLRGPSYDGLAGWDIVRIARDTLSLSIAAGLSANAFFANGSRFGGALTVPGPLSEKSRESLRAAIESAHRGADKAHKLMLLEAGAQYQSIGTTPRDAEFAELRAFQVREVARFFRMPPSRLGDTSDTNRATAEQETLAYFSSCLRRWLEATEQEFTAKLVSRFERSHQLIQHVAEDFLRGDLAARTQAYASALSHGWMTIDEVRRRENLPSLPDGAGATPRVPANTVPLNNHQQETE